MRCVFVPFLIDWSFHELRALVSNIGEEILEIEGKKRAVHLPIDCCFVALVFVLGNQIKQGLERYFSCSADVKKSAFLCAVFKTEVRIEIERKFTLHEARMGEGIRTSW